MLTAHLPAGYLAGRLLDRRDRDATLFWCALVGAVVPDIDLAWFYLVDGGGVHHRFYPTHWPLFWAAVCLPAAAAFAAAGRYRLGRAALALFAGALLHMALDSIAAPVFWLMPFDPAAVELVVVPARYSHWIVSFVLHWTFALELAIWLAAALVFARSRGRTKTARWATGPP